MAKIDTLKDNFNDNSLDTTKWDGTAISNGGNVVESGGVLVFDNPISFPGTSIAGVVTKDFATYDFDESQVCFQIKQIPVSGTAAFLGLTLYDAEFNLFVGFYYDQYSGLLLVEYSDEYILVDDTSYSAVNHKWLKIRETGGVLYFETSADGIKWDAFCNISTATVETANGGSVSSLFLTISVGSVSSTEPTDCIIDNINCPPRYLSLTGAGV